MFNDINIQFDDTRAKKAIAARASTGVSGEDPYSQGERSTPHCGISQNHAWGEWLRKKPQPVVVI
jgi:hypothetical protein